MRAEVADREVTVETDDGLGMACLVCRRPTRWHICWSCSTPDLSLSDRGVAALSGATAAGLRPVLVVHADGAGREVALLARALRDGGRRVAAVRVPRAWRDRAAASVRSAAGRVCGTAGTSDLAHLCPGIAAAWRLDAPGASPEDPCVAHAVTMGRPMVSAGGDAATADDRPGRGPAQRSWLYRDGHAMVVALDELPDAPPGWVPRTGSCAAGSVPPVGRSTHLLTTLLVNRQG